MRRLIQLLKILFTDNILDAREHYQHPELIAYYQNLIESGLGPEELETLSHLLEIKPKNILVYGSGSGRECRVLAESIPVVDGYEPVAKMIEIAFRADNIHYMSVLGQLISLKYDAIWVTKNLPSFLNVKDRRSLYQNLKDILNPGGAIFIRPDIMELSFRSSFRFKSASLMLKYLRPSFFHEEGDTLRVNLDKYIGDDHFVFYHYFKNEDLFVEELLASGLVAKKISGGFFQLLSSDEK